MIDETLAHFRVIAKLGEGGMGTVWRAKDTKLGRDVALKFLPEAFAADADRMARLTREAQVLASLNHPNIAGIYSVEEAQGGQAGPARFLVMELVEGEDLQERIARGPLTLDEALQITLQIANGLEEAHERGIIHRDLKPANVKLTPGKQVKILDFGLAKAFDAGSPTDSMPSGEAARRLSLSPTMTGLATQAGMLMGTAAYMSPEQARGEPVDRRADIWALGVVLMEMLTGKVVHKGKTISDTLASVLARDPAWDELPADTPRPVRRLLERCLEKDARERLRDVGEARIAIERYLEAPEAADLRTPEGAAPVVTAPPWKRALPWAAVAVLGLALVVTVAAWRPRPAPPGRAVRLALALPAEQRLFTGYGAATVLSPDGSRIAYVLGSGNHHELHVRALDQWVGAPLVVGEGMARPYQPFFAPDGQWVGFVTPSEMRKVPVSGGTPIKLCNADRPRGATWGADGTIVFAPSPGSGLMRIADAGGEPQPLTELDKEKGEQTHRWPQWLPGGKALIFTSHTKLSDFNEAAVELLVPDTGERRVLQRGGTYGRYVAAGDGSGFVVYANDGSLFAVPFDLERLEVAGSAAPVVEGVTVTAFEGSAEFSASFDGKLAYFSGASGNAGHAVVWVDREGHIEPLWEDEQFYRNPTVSPDGTRLAVDIRSEGQTDVWVYDIERGVPTRLTFSDDAESTPVWSRDGEYIYYSSEVDGRASVQRKPSDGSGDPEPVLATEGDSYPWSISPDGKLLAFHRQVEGANWDIGLLRLDQEAQPQMLTSSEFTEVAPVFSPDGRYLAYMSTESGNVEIYVRPVEGRGKWQISTGGGAWPLWSPTGTELVFWNGSQFHAVEVDTAGPTFRAGRPRLQFEGPFADIGLANPSAVTPEGRIIAFRATSTASADSHQHLQLVLDWDDELRTTLGR